MLRHTLAALAYRAGKVVRDAPSGFTDFRASADSRSAGEILAHMSDLLDWAISIVDGRTAWKNTAPQPWDADVERWFDTLERFDAQLAGATLSEQLERQVFQGPIADALQHTGQLALLRRLAGCPIAGENYFVAEIVEGRVGSQQTKPRQEF